MFLAPFPFGLVSFVCGIAGSIFVLARYVKSNRPKLAIAFVVGVVIPGGILS